MTLSVHCAYIPAPPQSQHWMRETFRDHLLRMPGGPRDCAQQAVALIRALRTGAAQASAAVLKSDPDVWLGWSVAMGGCLLFAYVRAEFRREGIGSELIGAVVEAVPVPVAYWTEDARGMAAHGVPLRYSIEAYQNLLAFVRGPARRAAA